MTQPIDEYAKHWPPPHLINLGIRIRLSDIPEYVAYEVEKDRLRWLRWLPGCLFPHRRATLDRLRASASLAILNKVIESGQEVMTNDSPAN